MAVLKKLPLWDYFGTPVYKIRILISANRHFQESGGDLDNLVIEIRNQIVHLVTKGQKFCCKAVLGSCVFVCFFSYFSVLFLFVLKKIVFRSFGSILQYKLSCILWCESKGGKRGKTKSITDKQTQQTFCSLTKRVIQNLMNI